MTDAGVPYDDAGALLIWIEHHLREVSPLTLERLLTHYGFEETGEMPTRGAARCAVWKHRLRDRDTRLAALGLLVYHSHPVAEQRVVQALQAIDLARRIVRERALADDEATHERGTRTEIIE